MRNDDLRTAVDVVNSTLRGPGFPELVKIASCCVCSGEFAMLPQDASLAEVRGSETPCPQHRAQHHANQRKNRQAGKNWNSKTREWTDIVSPEKRALAALAQKMRAEGTSVADIAKELKLSQSRIYEYLRKA